MCVYLIRNPKDRKKLTGLAVGFKRSGKDRERK
jgi:hypothetical protein